VNLSELIRNMAAAGAPAEAIALAVEAIEARDAKDEERRAGQRERTRRSRAKRDGNVTVTHLSQDGNGEVPPKKETSPTPPKEKTTPSTTEPNGSSKTRASRLPADWTLPIEWRGDAVKAGLPQARIDLEAEKMRDWSISSPNGAKREWRAAWRNWVKGAADKLPRGSPAFSKPERPDHFANYTRELIDGQDRSHGSDSRDWDDAQGVPILAIDYERR